jgi:hypothetical protein
MAENDPTIKLPTEGGTDTNDKCDKPDLRGSLHKQQVVNCEDNLDPHLDQGNKEVIRVALLTFDLKR